VGPSLPLISFSKFKNSKSKQHFFQGSHGYQTRCLSRFKEEHRIFLSKILSSSHHPQKTGAWNANKKQGPGCNGGHGQANGGTFTQTTGLIAKSVLLNGQSSMCHKVVNSTF